MIGGLSSLGFTPQTASPSKGKSTSAEDKMSFDDALEKTQDQAKDQPKDSVDTERAVSSADSSDVKEKSFVKEKSLPLQPGAPNLDGSTFPDRTVQMQPVSPFAKISDPTNKSVTDDTVNALTKRVVWSDFLRKMKNELGISAEEVLNAFGSLSKEDLAKPPEQTVDKIVMALGLDGQQMQMAKSFFNELIQKTKPKSMGEELARSERDISLTLMSQREIDRKNTERSVDRMQQQFFMRGAFQRPPSVTDEAVRESAQAVMARTTTPTATPINPDVQSTPQLSQNPMPPVAVNLEPVKSEKPDVDVDALVKKFMAGQAASKAAPMAETPLAPSVTQAHTGPSATAPSGEVQAALQQIFAKGAGTVAADAGSEFEDGDSDSDYTTDASFLGRQTGVDQQVNRLGGPSEFQSQLAATGSSQPLAVPDLVQQARVMVHDGGGEMKVTLTPEGLGEVAMRVSVKEGKVNVQMITESDEAKRMIERQLGELKTSLASQHLAVDSIKIDTATNLGKQLEQQYHEAQRQMAQQTLEQYRQDHQGWRRSFFEVPSAKFYKDQAEAPRDVRAPSTSSRRTGNRRLDLVA